MKASCTTTSGKSVNLYIPHGSDESYFYANVYLTHMPLYIPHGSDESSRIAWVTILILTVFFISHMVQMKEQFEHYSYLLE